jgi:hypothetical protein
VAVIGSGLAQWIALRVAIEHVQRVGGVSAEDAAARLIAALQSGDLRSRRTGPENAVPLDGRYEQWNGELFPRAWFIATIHNDGTAQFDTAEGHPLLRRAVQHAIAVRHEIEVGRYELLQLFPEPEAAKPTAAKAPPSRLKPFWREVEQVIMEWLDDEGCPEDRDGGQRKLEDRTADLLTDRGWEASPSTVRRHVRACMERYRKNTWA